MLCSAGRSEPEATFPQTRASLIFCLWVSAWRGHPPGVFSPAVRRQRLEVVISQVRHLVQTSQIIARTWTAVEHEREVPEHEVVETITACAPLWDELFPAEQARSVRLLVERVNLTRDGSDTWAPAKGTARRDADTRAGAGAPVEDAAGGTDKSGAGGLGGAAANSCCRAKCQRVFDVRPGCLRS